MNPASPADVALAVQIRDRLQAIGLLDDPDRENMIALMLRGHGLFSDREGNWCVLPPGTHALKDYLSIMGLAYGSNDTAPTAP